MVSTSTGYYHPLLLWQHVGVHCSLFRITVDQHLLPCKLSCKSHFLVRLVVNARPTTRNKPFLSCLKPLFQSEAKCKAIDMKNYSLFWYKWVPHLASFWKWDFLELGNGLLPWATFHWERENKTTNFSSSVKLGFDSQKFNFKEIITYIDI